MDSCRKEVDNPRDSKMDKLAASGFINNEALFQQIIANIPQAIFWKDKQGAYLGCNLTFARKAGLENPAQVFGKTDYELPWSKQDADTYRKDDREIIETGIPKLHIIEKLIQADGQYYWVDTSKVPLINESGEISAVLGIFEDITAQATAMQKLVHFEMTLQSILDNLQDSYFQADLAGRFSIANLAAAAMYGYNSVDEMIGLPASCLYANVAERMSLLEELRRQGKVKDWTAQGLRKDGTTFWVSMNVQFLRNERGEIVGTEGVVRDISERKRMMEELTSYKDNLELLVAARTDALEQEIALRSKAEEALTESERKYRDIVDYSTSIILEWDTRGTVVFLNKYGLDFFGFNREEIINHNVIGTIVEPVDSDGFDLDGKMKVVQVHPERFYSSENENIKKNGEKVWIAWTNKGIYDEDGQLVKTLSIGIDRTHQHEMEKALLNQRNLLEEMVEKRTKELVIAKEKAEESDRLKSAFLANMSHEIRTPMNGILGFSELLKEPDLSGDEQLQYIEMIEKAGARMLNIINNLISISKVESGQMEISISAVNINEQVDYVCNFFKPEAERKKIRLICQNRLPQAQATLNTDKEKVYAILTNLVNNAIKFTAEGSIEFGYVLTKLDNPPSLQFFVKDTGIGIPADRLDAIFHRFVQADIYDKQALQGAGLGLSISKAYVEMLGGKIWVKSVPGNGSTFYFTLPYNF